MDTKEKTLSILDVKGILGNVNFAEHSCIDMGWDFEAVLDYVNGEEHFFIRTSFKRKDINTGEFGTGWGRWETTPAATATETSVVMTAWVCVKLIVEHELLEGFEFHNKKVFNPHKSLEELVFPEKLPNGRTR